MPPIPLPDPCRLLIRARRAARTGSVEQLVRRRRDTHLNAVDMVVLHRDATAGHANAQCSTGACRPKLAMCACTAPSRVLEGATAGQHRPDPGPARRLAAASPAFRTHVIIYDRDPALDGAWAALRARYRARDAKVNIMRRPRCATTLLGHSRFRARDATGFQLADARAPAGRVDGRTPQGPLSDATVPVS